jgi:quinoprotein glucose dehydrogenase
MRYCRGLASAEGLPLAMKAKNRNIHLCIWGPLFVATMLSGETPKPPRNTNWSDYGGGVDAMQYTPLQQINQSNVSQLTQAWFYAVPGTSARFNFSPLIIDGVMYVLGKGDSIVALDALTGKEIWSHPAGKDPMDRGINYWESKDRSDRRLIFSADSYLQEIDARTGASIRTFGDAGRVNLREGLGRDLKTIPEIQTGTPGHVFENSIVLGSATSEAYGSPPGDIRAFNVLTGKLVWTFHTLPHPGEFGYETWPKDAWTYVGGVNTWGEFAIDEKRGIGYFPLGSPTYDFWGGDRLGAGLFGDCLLALDLRTGKRLWHFQTVHHDLWDYDPTTAPKLLTVRHDGKMVDIVAQATKSGFVFTFDRVTGKPLWPIEERPVPKSEAPGEESWPTQPIPSKPPPFARQSFTEKDVNPYVSDADKERILEILKDANNHGIFTPGTDKRDSIQIPADDGGANWGNGAADPKTGTIYLRTADSPELKLKLAQKVPLHVPPGASPETQGHVIFSHLCEGCHGPNRTGVGSPKDIGIDKFKTVVTGGEGEMPGFTDLSPAYLDALAAYISNPSASGPVRAGGVGGGMERLPPPPGITRYFGTYENRILSTDGLPAISPPWTSLVAIDMNEGKIRWRVPLGVVPGLAAKGITGTGSSRVTLAANRNAPLVTAGGLVFVASWPDRTIHAYDKENGKLLWEKEIEANPEGVPAVYEIEGREYIVFCASGRSPDSAPAEGFAWKAGKAEAQGYYVFALPKQ